MNRTQRTAAAIVAAISSLAGLAATAAAQELCIRANRGSLYAVGDGFARQTCRDGDQPYAAPARERGLRSCIIDALPGRTTVAACSCDPGEVVEMAGAFAASPADLVYDLRISPAAGELWGEVESNDYRTIVAELRSEQSGAVTLVLRCAAD